MGEAASKLVSLSLDPAKEAEGGYSDAPRFLELVFGSAPELISYLDTSYTYRYVNAAYERWFGVTAADCLGKSVPEVLGETAFQMLKPIADRALAGEKQEFRRTIPYKNGGTKIVDAKYIPDVDKSGRVQGFIALVHDVTVLEQARASAESKEAEVSRMVERLPAGISHWDRELNCLYANRRYCELFGTTPDKIKGMHVSTVIGRRSYELHEPLLRAALAGEAQALERAQSDQHGKTIHVLVSVLPDYTEGRVDGLVVFITDSTKLYEIEQERRKIEAKLINSAKLSSLGEMAGGVAHEINNPLTIIKGKAAFLRHSVNTGQFTRESLNADLEKIEQTTGRIAKIVKGLRAFSRDADNDPMLSAKIGDIIQDVVELCKERFKIHHVELSVGEVPEIAIECRSAQVAQILMNLLSNAYDAVEARPQPWVKIGVSVQATLVQIEVIDSGSGIDKALVERMMMPFFTTKDVGKGTGLGLSISRGIAEKHGGQLVYDESHSNTRFVLELPRKQAK